MRLLIIRHADPEYTIDGLTKEGHKQAEALSRRISSGYDGEIKKLYSSPMGRARATATYTEKILNMTADIEDWTRELGYWGRINECAVGAEKGMALWDMAGEYLRTFDPPLTELSQWQLVPDMKQVEEKYAGLCSSSDDFLGRLGYVREGGVYRVEKPLEGTYALFCHGGFGLTFLSHLLRIPLSTVWSTFWLAPSSVTTVLFEQRSPSIATPRCIAVSDLSHLHANNLATVTSKYEKPNSFHREPRPSGIKANFW